MAKPDIELLFGVATGGPSGDSGAVIKDQLEGIIKDIEPLKIKVEIDSDGVGAKWKKDLEKLIGTDGKTIDIKVSKIDASAAIAEFKADLQKIVNSISLSKGFKIDIKGLDVGDIATDLKQAGTAAKDSTDDVARFKAEIKALKVEGSSIDALYKGLTKATNTKNSTDQIESLRQKYVELGAAMEQMETKGATISNAYIEKVRVLQAEIKELIKTMSVKDQAADLEKSLTKTTNLLAELTRVENQWTAAKNGKSSGAYNTILAYKNQVLELVQALNTGKMSQREFDDTFDKISAGAKSAKKQIQAVGEATKSWQDRMTGLFGKLGQWITVTEVFTTVVQTFRKMVDCVIEVDTAMTELKKVTDATEATYDRFLINATSRTRELGATLSDVVRATADFARLGFDIGEASELADAAIVYKNVADGIDDINVASESIISTMQAFGVKTNDVMTIVDKFNEVSNNYAISSDGIGQALKRSAAAMAAAHATIDETIALATAANTTVQNPEIVGTAMRSLSMYLRASKTEAIEAGEDIEGMANSVSELRSEILKLTAGKVDLQIDENTFKGPYQIIKELYEVWDELTDTSRANILELIAGKRNSNTTMAIIENFDIAEKALATSIDSAGSALAENEKYLDSIAGRIEKMKASFEALSTSVIDSGLTKGIISIADALLRVTTIISDAVFDNFFTGFATLVTGGGIAAFIKNLD